MKPIHSRLHGILDYIVGLLLIAAPFALGFADTDGPAKWIPIAVGFMTLLYSACTNYELGLVRALSFPLHLGIDVISGLFLAASPWLFGFAHEVWIPHVVVGVTEVLVVALTRTSADTAHRHHHHHVETRA